MRQQFPLRVARTGLVFAMLAGACADAVPGPAALDTLNDTCETCRMTVSDRRFAAQLVAPGEVARFFDDIGCLARYLAAHPVPSPGAAAYVADHRTRAWVPAGRAVYSRVPGLATPMSSGLIAHGDDASRRADAEAAGATPVAVTELFGSALRGTRAAR